jgi:hypothetical protein
LPISAAASSPAAEGSVAASIPAPDEPLAWRDTKCRSNTAPVPWRTTPSQLHTDRQFFLLRDGGPANGGDGDDVMIHRLMITIPEFYHFLK